MPLPVVSIEVSGAASASPNDIAALVEACSAAYSAGRCELAATTAGAPTTRVVWEDGLVRVRIRVLPTGESRELDFRESDAVLERWRAVGLVVGTLADELARAVEPTPAPRQVPGARQSPVVEAPPPGTWLDAGVVSSPSALGWSVGGSIRGAHALPRPWFALVAMRYEQRPRDRHDVTFGWFTPSVGTGARFGTQALDLDLRVEAIGEMARASADAAGERASQSRWAPGVRAGFDAGYRILRDLELGVGGDVTYTGRPVEVRVRGLPVETIGPARFSLLAGVRLVLR